MEADGQVRGCCNKPGDAVVAWAKSQRDHRRRCPGVQQDIRKAGWPKGGEGMKERGEALLVRHGTGGDGMEELVPGEKPALRCVSQGR